MPLKRRRLLSLATQGTFLLTAGRIAAPLASEATPSGSPVSFSLGVASGDPQPDGVMLWTRAEPTVGDTARVQLEVALDEAFTRGVLQRVVSTGSDSDFTLRIFVDGLTPDTRYYYRFTGADGRASVTGRTRTAPTPGAERPARLALVSCQSYENGYYGAWARMLADDLAADEADQIDFVLHVGDFIYERSWDHRYRGAPQSRRVPDFPDGVRDGKTRYAVSLADYRHLYRTFLSDPDLQAARARWPFVCTWDDHEFSNDNFQAYSFYNDTVKLEDQRKLDANQAWFEFIPTVLEEVSNKGKPHAFRAQELAGDESRRNAAAVNSLSIYRRLRWGKLVDLMITDTRSYRDGPLRAAELQEQLGQPMLPVKLIEMLDAGAAYDDGQAPSMLPLGDGTVPNPARDRAPRTLLGDSQKQWFVESLADSQATWKIWANALPTMPIRVDISAIPLAGYEDGLLSDDAWAGFPTELAELMGAVESQDVSGLLVLSGDHHMHAAATLHRDSGDVATKALAVEFSTAGISSESIYEGVAQAAEDGNEAFQPLVFKRDDEGNEIPVWNMTLLDGVLASMAYSRLGMLGAARWLGPNKANGGMRYMDSAANGYTLVALSAAEASIDMVTMGDIQKPHTEAPPAHHTAHFRVPAWSAGQQPALDGPTFTGAPPFPFT